MKSTVAGKMGAFLVALSLGGLLASGALYYLLQATAFDAPWMLWALASLGLLNLLLLFGGLRFTKRSFVRPLELIEEAARRVRDLDFTHRVSLQTGDELESLATTVNEMSESLARFSSEKQASLEALTASEARYRKEAEEMVRSLLRISEKLNATLEIDTLMDELAREGIDLLGAESGFAGLRTPEGMACRRYFRESTVIAVDYCWRPGEGLPGWLITHRAPYLTNDAASDGQITPEIQRRFKIRSALCVPILDAHGEVIGFIEVHNRRSESIESIRRGFGDDDQAKLAAVSRIVSTAIQNALAYRAVLRADEALRASERRYRDLFENANDVIYTRDLAGNFTSFNKAAERVTGYTREEALQKNIGQILAPEYRQGPQPSERLGSDGGPATYELEIIAKNGRRVALEVSTRLVYEDGMPIGVQGIGRDVTERKRAERSLRQLSGRLLHLQDSERRRIARELHDSTAQNLAALAMTLSQVGDSVPPSPKAKEALAQAAELADQSLREIRTLSYLLHPPLLDELGLTSALSWYAEGFSQRSGIQVDLDLKPDIERLPPELEMTLFRIVQECLTNIHRHSGSTRAAIRLAPNETDVLLQVQDAGRGMPPEILDAVRTASAGVGVGIAGMRERVAQLGGRLEIDSNGGGTTVTAVLPVVGATP